MVMQMEKPSCFLYHYSALLRLRATVPLAPNLTY
jgi:hypothetical protein